MKRFVIRNYGASRQIPYKGQMICIANDSVIETDDEAEAKALRDEKNMSIIDRGSELTPPSPSDEKSGEELDSSVEESEEVSYENMTMEELQAIAKDREIETSELDEVELIAALLKYDETPDQAAGTPGQSDDVEKLWEIGNEVTVDFDDKPWAGTIKSINKQKQTARVKFEDGSIEVVNLSKLNRVEEAVIA